jgi:uncharacterized protein (DUF488 family)
MSSRTLATIGYQNLDLESFLSTLARENVLGVIDVRELPLSRVRGFSKARLSAALAGCGIGYAHVREAGNPFRKWRDRSKALEQYREHVRSRTEILSTVWDLLSTGKQALVCFEAHAGACHRSVLAEELQRLDPTLSVVHL